MMSFVRPGICIFSSIFNIDDDLCVHFMQNVFDRYCIGIILRIYKRLFGVPGKVTRDFIKHVLVFLAKDI